MRTSRSDRPAAAVTGDWHAVVARYARPVLWRSLWQLASCLALYAAFWYGAYRALSVSYWLSLACIAPAAGVLVRIFIIFHDCGHGSFFRSRKACDAVGIVLGLLVFTPYVQWTRAHAAHHATVGDLDRRGQGDVWTMTLEEYRASPLGTRALYRLVRNPLFLFGFGSFFQFLLLQRFQMNPRDRRNALSVVATDIALAGLAAGLCLLMGWRAWLLIQLPIMFLGAAAGVWLFYVQHQFEGVYWTRHAGWEYRTVALKGSSFYRLPRVLQWFTGNIGFHHVHHLSPRIPNYRLAACHRENPMFAAAPVLTFRSSLRSALLALYDEAAGRLVGFRRAAALGAGKE
jgi:omega-6 fatty acid desaturase (delta-12 desaturase)